VSVLLGLLIVKFEFIARLGCFVGHMVCIMSSSATLKNLKMLDEMGKLRDLTC
jgi:hypothetical protein